MVVVTGLGVVVVDLAVVVVGAAVVVRLVVVVGLVVAVVVVGAAVVVRLVVVVDLVDADIVGLAVVVVVTGSGRTTNLPALCSCTAFTSFKASLTPMMTSLECFLGLWKILLGDRNRGPKKSSALRSCLTGIFSMAGLTWAGAGAGAGGLTGAGAEAVLAPSGSGRTPNLTVGWGGAGLKDVKADPAED